MDLHVGYPVKIGGTMKANILLDVFNLFNRQGATMLDQRYNLASDGACAGIPAAICNGDGGLLAMPNTDDPVGRHRQSGGDGDQSGLPEGAGTPVHAAAQPADRRPADVLSARYSVV